jgi:hypothetical protein
VYELLQAPWCTQLRLPTSLDAPGVLLQSRSILDLAGDSSALLRLWPITVTFFKAMSRPRGGCNTEPRGRRGAGSRDAKGMRLGMRARDAARHGLPVPDAHAPLAVGCNGRCAVRGKISGQDPGGGVALTTGGGWNVEYPSPGRIWRVTSVLAPAVSLLDVPS